MSDDYEDAARKIVTDLGESRARQLVEILEEGHIRHIRNVIERMKTPPDRDDELALSLTLLSLRAATDALDAMVWGDGTYSDLDDAGRARMDHRLSEALRRELGSREPSQASDRYRRRS